MFARCLMLSVLFAFPSVFALPAADLEARYGILKSELLYTPHSKIPVILRMSDHKTLSLKIQSQVTPVRELKTYDVAIVGGGPAGLTAALYLLEAGHSVIVLERNEKLGGLGMGQELNGVRAGGGAAYSAGPANDLELQIFKRIGLGEYQKLLSIDEPIDSYLRNGVLHLGIWEDHTLEGLPPSFALFKYALLKMAGLGYGRDDTPEGIWADGMSMARFVSVEMPKFVRESDDPVAKKIWARFAADPRMDEVIDLMDLYGRSALGGEAHKISARQFIDFYESEIHTRYTGTLGTGTVVEAILNSILPYAPLLDARVNAPVAEIENVGGLTRTMFIENGVPREVYARKVIFAAPITLAPKLIKNLAKTDPEKMRAISSIKMTDYAVHVARLKGHPFRATYDTWSFGDRDPAKPTDFILGRWQDPKINGYQGMRNFEKDPADDFGVISIYQPLGESKINRFDKQNNLRLVEAAVEDMLAKLGPLAARDGQKIEVEMVESYRWPDSIHIVSPGFLKKIPVLTRPNGNIHFANNTVGAPELESAMATAYSQSQLIIESFKSQNYIRQTRSYE